MIHFENLIIESSFHGCFISVDGTNISIQEPTPFSSIQYYYKLNGAGLSLEVEISISDGHIVWTIHPFFQER